MKHLGDITKIQGDKIAPVDIITGGSPCQDLSIAGKRAGLVGERSGLFMEQIRIIKEMRRKFYGIYPKYMLWENVPGAFSSNKGEDFRVVLEETARIVEPEIHIPGPENGKWTPSGCIMGDGWSIAWRVTDNQYWGTPQRRRRISLVADFRGATAPEVLFECESMSGHPEKSCGAWKDLTRNTAESIGDAISFQERAGKPGGGKGILIQGDHVGALSTVNNQVTCYGISPFASNGMLSSNPHSGIYEAETSRTLDINGGNPNCNQGGIMVVENHPQDSRVKVSEDGIVQTLPTRMGTGGGNIPMVMSVGNGQIHEAMQPDVELAKPLNCMHDQQMIAYGLDRASYNQGRNAKFNFSVDEETIGSQTAKGPGAVFRSIVRRLTPMECERLQGFPDGWTDIGEWFDTKGKKHKTSDSPRYKALGNSIALPFWYWLAGRMVHALNEEHFITEFDGYISMGSLFDGIGGFPLAFSAYGVHPSWASEIEEFPIAVTKARFGE